MAAGAFAAPNRESDQPKHGEDDSDNPKQMDREAHAEEEKHE
jgi:hypothetical protein